MAPVITVLGATGVQGGSVVSAALKSGQWSVRAITRNTNSEKAKALAARGVEVVSADINDEASLINAFKDSTAVYAVTDFFEPFSKLGPDQAQVVEIQQGKNLANAASKTPSLKHYIWSTLPDGSAISGGKYKVPHFQAKVKIDEHIKSLPELVEKTTFLWVTWYATNYSFPMFTPIYVKASGKYIQPQLAAPSTPILTIGDAGANVGTFAMAILSKPEVARGGKYVVAYVDKTTTGELLEKFTKATGKPSVYVKVDSLDEYDAIWPAWGKEMGVMMQFWDEYKDKSWSGHELITPEMLGVTGGVGVEEAYKAMDWDALL